MNFRNLYILAISLMILISAISIARKDALKNPASCLSTKTKLLEKLKEDRKTVGWRLPHCTIIGSWRAQQCDDGGNCWCVRPDGSVIAGTKTPPGMQSNLCRENVISQFYNAIIDDYF